MLDTFTSALLKYLYSIGKNGEYKVEIITDVLEQIKTKDKNKLINALNYLKEKEYIKVKYFDEEEICFCLLTNANIYIESLKRTEGLTKHKTLKFILQLLLIFMAAFLGAFTAVMVVHYFL